MNGGASFLSVATQGSEKPPTRTAILEDRGAGWSGTVDEVYRDTSTRMTTRPCRAEVAAVFGGREPLSTATETISRPYHREACTHINQKQTHLRTRARLSVNRSQQPYAFSRPAPPPSIARAWDTDTADSMYKKTGSRGAPRSREIPSYHQSMEKSRLPEPCPAPAASVRKSRRVCAFRVLLWLAPPQPVCHPCLPPPVPCRGSRMAVPPSSIRNHHLTPLPHTPHGRDGL